VGDAEWYDDMRTLLENAYLAASDPRGQSGFSGDKARWERGRRIIAQAIDRDGAFLDVGCANGLLLETVTTWAGADGHRIEPYGLDISARLAAMARSRLPAWADRIFVGNAMTWRPPRRFDFVRTELEYVPDARRPEYLVRLLRDVVAPGGRLIVCAYGSATRPDRRVTPIGDILRGFDLPVAGEAEAADLNGIVFTRVAWIDRAAWELTGTR
jgi:SAM-dependent methyltransferase